MARKVLIVLNCMHNGGTEAFVMNYYRCINREKYHLDFLVVCGDEDYYKEEIESLGGRVYHISPSEKNRYIKNLIAMKKFEKKKKYDVIHIQSCSLKFMAQAAVAGKLAGGSVIMGHAHSVGDLNTSFANRLIKKILKGVVTSNIDYGFACSRDAGAQKYSKKFMESSHYAIIPNAINTAKYEYNEEYRRVIREKYGLKDSLVLGIIGRLDTGKNHQLLVQVVGKLKDKLDVKLLAVGDGYTKEALQKQAEELGVLDRICFAGQVSDAEKYYSAMDIFCLPSHVEGFPFVLVEAQANGLKCLVSANVTEETNISGCAEYLSIDTVESWCEAILENGIKRMDAQAVQRVKDTFDMYSNVNKLEKYYDIEKNEV